MKHSLHLALCGNFGRDFLHLLQQTGAPPQIRLVDHTAVLHLAPTQLIDLVFVEHSLPETDGVAAVRNFKRRFATTPVIVFSEDYSGDTIRMLLKSGADDVLRLPTTSADLQGILETYLLGYGKAPALTAKKIPAGSFMLAAAAPGLVLGGTAAAAQVLGAPAPDSAQRIEQDVEYTYRGLEINFFGQFLPRWNGRRVDLTNQAKQIFAYLAYYHPRPQGRDHLARVFWPDKYDMAPDSARRSLNVEITRIRNSFRNNAGFDGDIVVFENNSYHLNLDRPLDSDVIQFRELHRQVHECLRRSNQAPDNMLLQVIQLYTGNFLEDFPADHYNWIDVERQHLGSVFEQLADLYSGQLCHQGDYWKAASVCNEILSRDPRMEAIHRRLMECYHHLGMHHKLEAQYRLCCLMMEREFQSRPSPETEALYQKVRK